MFHVVIRNDRIQRSNFIVLSTCLMRVFLEGIEDSTYKIYYENLLLKMQSKTNVVDMVKNEEYDPYFSILPRLLNSEEVTKFAMFQIHS
ncbi:unnamed protein product [Pichia kudriavzevii]